MHSSKAHPGWVKKGTLKVFDQACYDSQDVLSPVLKSPYGYHIFFVERKKAEKQKTFTQVQKQIFKILKNRKVKEQFQTWLKQELATTSVFINQTLINAIHIQYKTPSLKHLRKSQSTNLWNSVKL